MSIETFALVKERALIAHINTRKENHGDEIKKGYDIKVVLDMNNSVLLKFHPELRSAFYKHAENRDIDPDHMPCLRFPLIESIDYPLEIPRTVLRVHDPDHSSKDIVLGGGKTNKFSLNMKEGGSVQVQFRVQFSDPKEEDIFNLYRVEFQNVQISLECAEEEKQEDNFEAAESLGKEPLSEARMEAESLFSKPTPESIVQQTVDEPVSNVESITKVVGRKKRSAGAAPE